MSRSCELTGVKKQMGRYVPIERSQTGVRTLRSFEPNIQKIAFLSDLLGKVTLKVAVKTIRSIEHNGGLDGYILSRSAKDLSLKGKLLKKAMLAKLEEKGEKPPVREHAKRRKPKVTPKRAAAAAKKAGTAKPAKTTTRPKAKGAPGRKPAPKKAEAKPAAKKAPKAAK